MLRRHRRGPASGRCASPRCAARAPPSSSFLLAPGSGGAQPGQYLTVRVPGPPPLTRSYSLSDISDERGYRISVKREGAASRYLHDHVKVGDELDVAAPRGSFVLRGGDRPVVLVSAGVGATPVLAMLHALVREHGTRPVWWVHGARNRDEHAFAAEVDELLGAFANGHRRRRLQPPGGRRERLRRRGAASTSPSSSRRRSRRTPTTTCAGRRRS